MIFLRVLVSFYMWLHKFHIFPKLTKHCSLCSDFDISYLLVKASNSTRPDVYLSLTSDWDLDAAFHTASFPILNLKVDPVKKSGMYFVIPNVARGIRSIVVCIV